MSLSSTDTGDKAVPEGDFSNPLFDAVAKNDKDELIRCLDVGHPVDGLDADGMTPLQHACFKGRAELCKLLLGRGASVNYTEHPHSYTTLHFAALSGSAETTRVVLEAGVDPDKQNSVNRTAAQMAAFVSQHQIVTLINNYFSKEYLLYFTKLQGLDTEPRLAIELVEPLHSLCVATNLNPINLVLKLRNSPKLMDNLPSCKKVLDLLCEKCMKQRETQEALAMKLHYCSSIISVSMESVKEGDVTLDKLLKKLVRTREGSPLGQETFIRSSIREFPYHTSALFQQIGRTLSASASVALDVLSQAVNGSRGMFGPDNPVCATCDEVSPAQRCSACRRVGYCDSVCQKLHWGTHKPECGKSVQ